jgi:hypothetical protein
MQSLTAANVRKTPGKSALINIVTDSGRAQLKRDVYLTGKPRKRFTK